MKHRKTLSASAIATIAVLQAACISDGGYTESSSSPFVGEEPPIVTEEEATYDAAASITEDNADAMFAELEASIQADLEAMDG